MVDYKELLKEQLNETDKMIWELEKRISQSSAKDDLIVKATFRKGTPQYYLRKAGEKKYKYVRSAETEIVRSIVQNAYDKKMLFKLEGLQRSLLKFLKKYNVNEINNIYGSLSRGRRILIKPLIIPDEELIKKWYAKFEINSNGFQDERKYATERGDMVRSKSEKIIADILYKHGIPYVYEPVMNLNGHIKYPDFAALNIKKQKTIYWEHFGLISEPGYAEKNMRKLLEYEEYGLLCGDNLIFSMESPDSPLSIKMIEKKIKKMLLE